MEITHYFSVQMPLAMQSAWWSISTTMNALKDYLKKGFSLEEGVVIQ